MRPKLYDEVSKACFHLVSQARKCLTPVLALRNHLHRNVNDEDLPRVAIDRVLAVVGKIHWGVLGWKEFLLAVRAMSRYALELEAFISWARDVQAYPNVITRERQDVRGAIFEDFDFDIFLAFAKIHKPVYLRINNKPVPSNQI